MTKHEFPNKLKTIDGREPAEHYNGWENFLNHHCELRDEADGVKFFGSVNCNYIVFPNGIIHKNFGFWGKDTMKQVREKGWLAVYDELQS